MHSCVSCCTSVVSLGYVCETFPRRRISSQKKLCKPSSTNLSQCLQIYVSCFWLALFIASGFPCFLLLVGLVSCLWLALWVPGRKTRMSPRRNPQAKLNHLAPLSCLQICVSCLWPTLGVTRAFHIQGRATLDILQPGFSAWWPPARQGPADIEGEIQIDSLMYTCVCTHIFTVHIVYMFFFCERRRFSFQKKASGQRNKRIPRRNGAQSQIQPS